MIAETAVRRRPRFGAVVVTALLVLGSGAVGGWLGWDSADRGGSSSATSPTTAASVAPPASTEAGNGASSDEAGPDVDAVAAKVSPAVVNINTLLNDGGEGAATGMVITAAGEVLTNNHVVESAVSVSVELPDGSRHRATVIGTNVTEDVAIIMINGVSDLHTITTRSAPAPSVGDTVIGIGNARGRGGAPTASAGSIIALDQTVTAAESDGSDPKQLNGMIRVDAGIQPGDSGGPLVDVDAKVVGMDTAAVTRPLLGEPGGTRTEAYAIPIERALSVAKQIEAGNTGNATARAEPVRRRASIKRRRLIEAMQPVAWRTRW